MLNLSLPMPTLFISKISQILLAKSNGMIILNFQILNEEIITTLRQRSL